MQPCTFHHEPSLFCSLLLKKEATQLCPELKFKANKSSFINHPTKSADGNISYQHIFKPTCNVAWCQVPFNIISLVKRQYSQNIKQYSETFKTRERDSGKMAEDGSCNTTMILVGLIFVKTIIVNHTTFYLLRSPS